MHARHNRSTIAGYDSPAMRPQLSEDEARRLLITQAARTTTEATSTDRGRPNLLALALTLITVALWTATAYVIASIRDEPTPQKPAHAEKDHLR